MMMFDFQFGALVNLNEAFIEDEIHKEVLRKLYAQHTTT